MHHLQYKIAKRVVNPIVKGNPQISDTMERRLLRFFEEAVELAQSLDLSEEKMQEVLQSVLKKEKGNPSQEMAGVFTCLVSVADKAQVDLFKVVDDEVERVVQNIDKIIIKERNKVQEG